jgi:hypothetical protein
MNKFALILVVSFTISTCHPVGELDITSIPSETFQDGILPYLKPKDLCSVRLTSKNFKDQADEYLKHNVIDQEMLNKKLWNIVHKSYYSSYYPKDGNKNKEIIKFWLDHGAQFDRYLFCDTAESCSPEIVSLFLDVIRNNGDDVKFYLNNNKNSLPLHNAANRGNYPVIKLLLENDGDPNLLGMFHYDHSALETAIDHLKDETHDLKKFIEEKEEKSRIRDPFGTSHSYSYRIGVESRRIDIERAKSTVNLLYKVSNDETITKAKVLDPNGSSCSII